MRLIRFQLPKAVRAVFLGTFLATAAVGMTACGEEETNLEETGEELDEAADEVQD